MTPKLTHIALHVADLDACIDFYRELCGLEIAHQRNIRGKRVVWLAEAGKETSFVFVLLPGGPGRNQAADDFSHLGFALASRAEVDAIAERGRTAGCLAWHPRQEPYPVGYYCGLSDPDGHIVEFSYGQPLGAGAKRVVAEMAGA